MVGMTEFDTLLFAYCCIPCQLSLAIVHQPKALSANKDYLVTYHCQHSCEQLEGNAGKYGGGRKRTRMRDPRNIFM